MTARAEPAPALPERPSAAPLLAEARGIAGTAYALRQGGEPVGEVRFSLLRARGTLTADGQTFELRRSSERGRPFLLVRAGEELARAYKPSALRDRFELDLKGQRLEFRQAGLLSRDFVLSRNGEEVGRARRSGLLRERATLELPAGWPLPVQVFLLYLARVVWQREQAAYS